MNIILIGARACGKSTIGKLVATQMLRTFVDLDDLALREFSLGTVSDVWREYGEGAWRNAETRAFNRIARRFDQIIALGGGAPMIPEVRNQIQEERRAARAIVCFLHCPPHTLAERMRDNRGDRPSLTGADPVEEIAHILRLREETYRELADVTVQTGENTPAEVAEQICRLAMQFATRRSGA